MQVHAHPLRKSIAAAFGFFALALVGLLLALPATAHAATTFTGAYDTYATVKKITFNTEYVRTWTGDDEHSSTEDRHIYTFTAPANGYATFSGTGDFYVDSYDIAEFGEDACAQTLAWFEDADREIVGELSWWTGVKPSFSMTSADYDPLIKGKRYYLVVMPPELYESGKSSSYTFKLTFNTIVPAANTVKVAKAKVKKTLKLAKLKKKARTVALPKARATYGDVTWKVVKKDKKKVLSLKNGKIKVKKGAKAGTYTIKVRAKVAADIMYKAAQSKVVTIKVKVKK